MPIIFKDTSQKQNSNDSNTISTAEKDSILSSLNKMPVHFIINVGQIDSKVKYYAKGGNFGFYFTRDEVMLSFTKKTSKDNLNRNSSKTDHSKEENAQIGVALALQFIDANPNVKIEGQLRGTGKINYLKGNDPQKWFTDLSTYEKVVYKDLWMGIDLVFYGANNHLKYEFILHPGSSPKDIKLRYKGADDISLDMEGNILIESKLGILIDERPISYQAIKGKRVTLDSSFTLKKQDNKESIYGFTIEKSYNPDYPIIIDPGLVYSTYLGRSGNDLGRDIVIDNSGNAYVTGFTSSVNFPITPGAFQTTFGGDSDAFVTKLNPTGSALIYSTYLGGDSSDDGRGIAIDSAGNAYVTGETSSGDFPTTPGAFQTALAGNSDAFITKLNSTGSMLIYSTYLGGNDNDEGNAISIDSTGSAYVIGTTESGDFPTTPGAFQMALGGSSNAFITKINAIGSTLIYSTYLGGFGFNIGNDIAVDNAGNAYVTGNAGSVNFPTTPGAFQTTFSGGGTDAFITKLNPAGSNLIYSTYLGGNSTDEGEGIAIDTTGNAYVTGNTASSNFPTTPGAFQTTHSGSFDVFVTKLNPVGSALVYSTYIGGNGSDVGCSISIDNNRNAYVTGDTASFNFPITPGAFQTTLTGPQDAFVTKLNPTGSALIYSTYLGGSSGDRGEGITSDNNGNAYVVGTTGSRDFPTTIGAFQTALFANADAFISKINTNTISPQIKVRNQNITAVVYESASN
ncbi:SBBP repeat-containing protein [Wukongibacter baidiensis]|uniref:DUF7948 domain-containing protein n=1 Tax=Wukongibacter baidiensis TaxID=1723361 RepID=UPI003D7FD0E1